MTDEELIARLRSDHPDHLTSAAADRIETLIAERDALFRRATLAEEWRDHDKTRAEAAEAKLAKAVEALEEISEYDTGATAGLAYTAKHHLAEIKGESHE